MQQWVSAYEVGMAEKDAQEHARNFSSRMYASHQRVSESIATWLIIKPAS